jgi:phthiocerol/phenolphthiocerol synthesis type-I polyketide synthase E
VTTDHLAADEIAVVGMAGRFPGAPDVAALWRNLLAGVDSVHDHTDDELRAIGLSEWLIADPALVRGAGRLDGVADFDADFFGVPAAEAALLDPQHRLFLEQSWVALQDAGPPDPSVVVGVFAGSSTNRYFLFHLLGNPTVSGAPADDREAQLVVGAAPDYLPAQVAYRLGTTGPAIAVQTACSSSLVAVCTAAQSLLDYRCDLALAGGVSVTEPRFRHTPGGLVSPDGRCRAFDAAGLGSGYGSGVAVLALRRLADALADGDQVYAVLHGWAVNNDGSTRAGFAAPGLDGQATVVAEALACASLSGEDIGYVEAHSSGTLLGDAIELAALRRAFGPAAGCAIGSLRTNLGNLDAAAGAAGLVKAVFAVREGMIPASLHHTSPNPQADFAGFSVPTATTAWTGDGPRLAGVSSFGLGGTNAHVIVGQPPAPAERGGPPPWVLLAVSARTDATLREVVTALREHLAAAPADPWLLADVAHTLAARTAFRHRAAFPAADPAGALAALDAWLAGASPVPQGTPVELVVAAQEWTSGGDPAVTVDGARRVWLPPYPFRRTRHWIEAP